MPCAKAIRKSLIFTEVILICDKLESKEENVTPAYLTGEKKKKACASCKKGNYCFSLVSRARHCQLMQFQFSSKFPC